ncbi:Tim44/TimA family putative adaptor protein [Parvularcula dongshanensis]|uniref:Putative lipid-binding transport protein (Tim44 family) n=1 Tax=Parvularcula dongshanensis TaxID=1173995 RepID=A0A840I1L0_9PROT|nr:Tim44/TimA family putative adaptor protein [Parvularcula dongshanensis]MBB4658235.1 putative lipid-binding transport protein (Tim44 family) [Parvularcula dongshanensis]
MDPSVIFFFALAAFLSYRLFTVLGTKGGHEPEENERPRVVPTAEARTEAAEAEPETEEPRPSKPLPAWAQVIREDDPRFDPAAFQAGAKAAYEMIVTAFARGDLSEVADYLDPSVRKAFEVAIDGRTQAKQTLDVTFVGIERADVVDAHRQSAHIEVTVDFASDQIRVTRDAGGEVIDGDPARIDAVRDRWTFARPLRSKDPNWTLVATGGDARD